jgi:hypothetical protein
MNAPINAPMIVRKRGPRVCDPEFGASFKRMKPLEIESAERTTNDAPRETRKPPAKRMQHRLSKNKQTLLLALQYLEEQPGSPMEGHVPRNRIGPFDII